MSESYFKTLSICMSISSPSSWSISSSLGFGHSYKEYEKKKLSLPVLKKLLRVFSILRSCLARNFFVIKKIVSLLDQFDDARLQMHAWDFALNGEQ